MKAVSSFATATTATLLSTTRTFDRHFIWPKPARDHHLRAFTMSEFEQQLVALLTRVADALEQQGSADDLLNVADVAALLRISDDKVRDHIRAGRLRGYNLNNGSTRPHVIIKRSAVYEFLETLVEPPPPQRKQKAIKRFDPGDWAT